ncbi:MAG: sigma-70 family RNA polymerase sigma factor [Anaerolineales bacterium]|nr:sigma-70 family RNA polymerase sigma factor [Anaerolineales bacterium]
MNDTPLTEQSDAILVARARGGDSEAFGSLYRRYVDPIYRYLFARLGESKEAEDLTEDVFFRAFQALGTYHEQGWPFSAFLYQVAKNVLIDYYRRQKTEVGYAIPSPVLESLRPLDEHVIRDEQIRDLRRAMEEIPLNYREVIILRIILAMPTAVVANWMNLTEGATRVLLHRALASLRSKIQEQT